MAWKGRDLGQQLLRGGFLAEQSHSRRRPQQASCAWQFVAPPARPCLAWVGALLEAAVRKAELAGAVLAKAQTFLRLVSRFGNAFFTSFACLKTQARL